MAWNPSPEVAAVRDAAKKLGAQQAVVVYVLPDGRVGAASYGKTRALCDDAKGLLDHLFHSAQTFYSIRECDSRLAEIGDEFVEGMAEPGDLF